MSPLAKRLLMLGAGAGCGVWGLVLVVLLTTAAWLPAAIAEEDDESPGADTGTPSELAPDTVPATYRGLVAKWGNHCPSLNPPLLAALLDHESGWNPRARSPVGAQGLAQFMPDTWTAHGIDGNKDGRKDPWDPADSIPSAAIYLCYLAGTVKNVKGDSVSNMLAAYNAGPGAVQKYSGIPPYKETRNYVHLIRANKKKFTATGKPGTLKISGHAGKIRSAARSQIGKPYVWGGGNQNGPTGGGFDCSGLTTYAIAKATNGKTILPRTSQQQRKAGEHITKKQMEPGDLIVINNDGNWGHVGIYAGRNRMIHAPRSGKNVEEIPLKGYWEQFPWDIRRVI